MKKLIILDLNKNYNIQLNNCNYLMINKGLVKFRNSKKLGLNVNNQKRIYKEFIKTIKIFFTGIKKELSKNLYHINPLELEFFNLRNDKYGYLDRMFVLFFLKKKKLHKKFKIEIISDNKLNNKIYKDLFGKNASIKIVNYNEPPNNTKFLLLKYLKFLFKAGYFIILNNLIIKKNILPKNENIFLSLFPYLYKNNDIILYPHKEKYYLNFSLTDETHLNLKAGKYLKHLKQLSKNSKIFSVEKEISLYDLIISFGKFCLEIRKFEILPEKIFYYQNINCYSFLYPHIKTSFFNRSKLFIYEKFLQTFNETYKKNVFHYFSFEYNFGFFLKKNLKKIKTFIGYQHGIYTNNLMWLNLFSRNKSNIFLPDTVICNRKDSYKAYKKNFNQINIKEKKEKFKLNFKISKNKNEKNILVFLGQHDMEDTLYYFLNKKEFWDKKIYFKLHPNNKRLITIRSKNFYFINKIDNKKKYKVFLSPTTTLIYDFKKYKMKFNLIKYDYRINLWS